MNIVVCIKQVPDTTEIKIDPVKNTLIRTGVPSIMNPFDKNALETGLSLKDRYGGKVTVISMGPPQAKAVLREALAMGADEAYLVTDRAFGGADTLATSYTLAQAVRKLEPFDMIFCGQESIDSNTAQVGPQLASMLGIPDVSAVTALALTGRTAEITRQMEEESEVLTAELPLLATVAPSLNHPRYPSIQGLQKKWTVKAQILTAADLQADLGRIGIQGSPTQVKRVRPVAPPKKENLVIQETKTADSVRVLMQALQKAQVF